MQYNFLQPFLRKEKRWETGYRYLRSCMFIIGMLWSALVFAQAPNQFGGTGGTPAGFQVDANFLSQQLGIPGTTPYNGQEILPGQDWGGTNGVLLWNGTRYIPGKNTFTNAQWIVDEIWAAGKVDLSTFAGSNKNDDDISAAALKWVLVSEAVRRKMTSPMCSYIPARHPMEMFGWFTALKHALSMVTPILIWNTIKPEWF